MTVEQFKKLPSTVRHNCGRLEKSFLASPLRTLAVQLIIKKYMREWERKEKPNKKFLFQYFFAYQLEQKRSSSHTKNFSSGKVKIFFDRKTQLEIKVNILETHQDKIKFLSSVFDNALSALTVLKVEIFIASFIKNYRSEIFFDGVSKWW